jgi:C-terminal processing protease CtpA/Prc
MIIFKGIIACFLAVVTAHSARVAEMGSTGVWIVNRKAEGDPLRTGQVFPKSPAEKVGIKLNSYLISVNGTNVVKIPFKESIQVIRGPVGSTVTLELANPERTVTNKYTVKRGKAVLVNGSVVEITDN